MDHGNLGGISQEGLAQQIKEKQTQLSQIQLQVEEEGRQYQTDLKQTLMQNPLESQKMDEEGVYKNRLTLIPQAGNEEKKRLEKELNDGYKKAGKKKSEREEWERDLRERIALADQTHADEKRLAQKKFVNEYINAREKTTADLKKLEEDKKQGVSDFRTLALNTVKENGIDLEKIARQTQDSTSEQVKKIHQLALFLKALTSMDTSKLESEYNTLQQNFLSFGFAGEGIVGEQFERGAGDIADVGITMILSSSVKELSRLVNSAPPELLEDEELSKLHALSFQTEKINTALLVSDDYHSRLKGVRAVKESLAVSTEIETLQNREAIFDIRKKFIETGNTDPEKGPEESWRLGAYADEVIRILGEEIFSDNKEAVSKKISQFNENVKINENAIEQTVAKLAEKPEHRYLENEELKEKAIEFLTESFKQQMLTEQFSKEEFIRSETDGQLTRQLNVNADFLKKASSKLFEEGGQFLEYESDLKAILSTDGQTYLPEEYNALLRNTEVVQVLSSAEEGERQELVQKFSRNFLSNQAMVEQWILTNASGAAERYYKVFMDHNGEYLFTKSMSFILSMLDNFHAGLYTIDQNLASLVTAEHGKTVSQIEGMAALQTDTYTNVAQLRSELLFGDSAFAGPEYKNLFEAHMEQLTAAVVSLAKKGAFGEYGLNAGCTEADFNNLVPADLKELCDKLKTKIMINAAQWALYPSDSLIEGMLSLDKDAFEQSLRRQVTADNDAKLMEEAGFASELLDEEDIRSEQIVYSYIDQKASRASWFRRLKNKETRAGRRSSRMSDARSVKEALLAKKGREGVERWIKLLEMYTASGKGQAAIASDAQAELTQIAEELQIDVSKMGIKEMQCEIPLCDQEQYVATAHSTLIQQAENKKFNADLAADARLIAGREAEFWKKVLEVFPAGEQLPEEVNEVYSRTKFHFSMKTGDAVKDKTDWEAKLADVVYYLENLKKAPADREHNPKAQLLWTKRIIRFDRVQREQGDIFEKIRPYLMENKALLTAFSASSEKEFEEVYTKLKSTVFPAVKVLEKNFGHVDAFFYQILNICKEQIFNLEQTKPAEEWEQLFNATYGNIIKSDFGEKDVERINKLIRGKDECKELIRYSDLILTTCDFEIFSNDSKFAKAMAAYTERVQKNEKKFEAFWQRKVGNLTKEQRATREAAIKASCRMMVREHFLEEQIEDSVFISAWDKAIGSESDTLMSTNAAVIRMNVRRQKLATVVEGKEKGREASVARAKSLEGSQRLMAKRVSPVVAAALEKQGKSGKDLIPAEKDVSKAYRAIEELYSGEPAYKKDMLKLLYLSSEKYRNFLSQFHIVKKVQEAKVEDQFKLHLDAIDMVLNKVIEDKTKKKLTDSKNKVLLSRMMGLCISNFDSVESMTMEEVTDFVLKHSADFFEKMASELTLDRMLKGVSEVPILREEFDKTRIQLSYEMYSKDAAVYKEHVQDAVNYFERAAQVASALKTVAGDDQGLLAGLYDYFYHEISGTEVIDAGKLCTEAKRLIEDADIKKYMVNSDSLLGSVGRASLGGDEKKISTVMDRERFTERISALVSEEQKEKLGNFSAEDMKMFALLISEPALLGGGVNPIGMDLVHGAEKVRTRERKVRKVVALYRSEGKTDYEPDYEKALYTVTKTKKAEKLSDEDTVKKAIGFIEIVKMAQIRDMIDREADPMVSIEAMHGVNFTIETPSSASDFIAKLKQTASDEKAQKLAGRLGKLEGDSYRQALFILILQNRSLVDESHVSRYKRAHGAKTSYIDEDGREELKELVGLNLKEQLQIDGSMLEMAMAQAYSYQWNEDSVQFKEFKKRPTKLDVDMLGRALDFVKELTELEYRKQVVKTAATPIMIKKSGNSKAVAALEAAETAGVIATTEKFTTSTAGTDIAASKPEEIGSYVETLIRQEAQADKKLPLLAGYLALTPQEKKMFYLAVSRRDLLDISKKDIWLNRFGMKDRGFVNGLERGELIDSYIAGTLKEADMTSVLYGLLSTQIDDTAKLEDSANLRTVDKAKHVSHRDTAIDWKLFARALQLVQRSKNEKQLIDEQHLLKQSFGVEIDDGSEEADVSMLRRNIHNSGTRFTRFLSRRAVDEGIDFIQDYVPEYMFTAVRFLLPKNWSDYLNDLKPFEEEEDDGWEFDVNAPLAHVDKLAEKVDDVAGLFNAEEDMHIGGFTKTIGEKIAGEEKSGAFQDFLGTVGDYCSYVQNGIAIAQGAVNIGRLVYSDKKDEKTEEEDKRKMQQKLAELPDDKAQFLQQAQERNASNVGLAKKEAIDRQIDEILNASAELLGDTADELIMEKLGSILLKEAVHTINFIRGYVRDEKNIDAFFKVKESLAQYKEKLKTSGIDTAEVDWDERVTLNGRLRVFCEINGYENITELSEVVGMNITESVLFSASKLYKGTVRDKLVAQTIMKTLGLKDLIGNISSDAAQKLNEALMGEDR